jgi:hypothetical protein
MPGIVVRAATRVVFAAAALALAVAPLNSGFAQSEDAAPVARAFQLGLASQDVAGMLDLFADDGTIKERVAVLAAGRERLQAWIERCLTRDFSLVVGSAQIAGNRATWQFEDWTRCYWLSRPDALMPGWNVNPADGTVELVVREGRIASVTLAYSAQWEARRLEAQAAPIRAAQAQATQRAHTEAVASATRAAEATKVAAQIAPHAPDTQARTTPSPALWLAGTGLMLATVALAAAARPRPPL